MNATDTPLSAVQKENYTASIAQDPKDAEDDIREISNPNVSEKPKEDVVMETSPPRPKRKRGRPRKVKTNTPTDTVEQEIATETPAGLADGKRGANHQKQRRARTKHHEVCCGLITR
jgi:hypothetical protein